MVAGCGRKQIFGSSATEPTRIQDRRRRFSEDSKVVEDVSETKNEEEILELTSENVMAARHGVKPDCNIGGTKDSIMGFSKDGDGRVETVQEEIKGNIGTQESRGERSFSSLSHEEFGVVPNVCGTDPGEGSEQEMYTVDKAVLKTRFEGNGTENIVKDNYCCNPKQQTDAEYT